MAKKKLTKKPKWYTESDAHGASSKFGQLIGEAFADVVLAFTENYLVAHYPDYVLLEPEIGKSLVKLEMFGGTSRQLDNVIIPRDSSDPVALFESKWLKDARHHNDKGAWILQLKEIRKKYPSVRGAAAILAGYWTEGVGVMFQSEAGVHTVLVATDDEVYATLQKSLDEFFKQQRLPALPLEAKIIRLSLPRSWDLANYLTELDARGELRTIAESWLGFTRSVDQDGSAVLGGDLIKFAIDLLLKPLPENPQVDRLEIALEINTGNTIYQSFRDVEDAIAFIQGYFHNPQAILEKITPKKHSSQILGDKPPDSSAS